MEKNIGCKTQETKAGALLCPVCCIECVEVQFDCEVNGVIVRNVKAFQCPICKDEFFSPEQQLKIIEKIEW